MPAASSPSDSLEGAVPGVGEDGSGLCGHATWTVPRAPTGDSMFIPKSLGHPPTAPCSSEAAPVSAAPSPEKSPLAGPLLAGMLDHSLAALAGFKQCHSHFPGAAEAQRGQGFSEVAQQSCNKARPLTLSPLPGPRPAESGQGCSKWPSSALSPTPSPGLGFTACPGA